LVGPYCSTNGDLKKKNHQIFCNFGTFFLTTKLCMSCTKSFFLGLPIGETKKEKEEEKRKKEKKTKTGAK
jgi:hypothetical protein